MANLSEAIQNYATMQDAIKKVSESIATERANRAAELQTASLMRDAGKSTGPQDDLSTNP